MLRLRTFLEKGFKSRRFGYELDRVIAAQTSPNGLEQSVGFLLHTYLAELWDELESFGYWPTDLSSCRPQLLPLPRLQIRQQYPEVLR
jgi:hypothetical protein